MGQKAMILIKLGRYAGTSESSMSPNIVLLVSLVAAQPVSVL